MARIVKTPVTQHGKPYEVRWSWYDANGKRKFKKERFRTEREAKAKKREVEQAVADASLPDYMAGKATLAEWAERWYRYQASSIKPSTARGYRSILDTSVLPAFGHMKVRSISTADVQDFVLNLRDNGRIPPTIRHHHYVLRAVLAEAARARAILSNPALDTRLPTERSSGRSKPEAQFLTPEEVDKLATALASPYDLLVRFMAYTGLRAGEVSGLNVADLDLMRRQVTVRRTRRKIRATEDNPEGWEVHTPKSGKARKVPLPGWLCEDLREYLAAHPHAADPDAPLWPGRTNGGTERFRHAPGSITYDKPWERDAFYKRQFKPALRAAALPPRVRLHDLRHTYASICASAGIPAYRVAEYMGHASEGVTRAIYTHLFHEDATADMDRLGRPTQSSTNVTPINRKERSG